MAHDDHSPPAAAPAPPVLPTCPVFGCEPEARSDVSSTSTPGASTSSTPVKYYPRPPKFNPKRPVVKSDGDISDDSSGSNDRGKHPRDQDHSPGSRRRRPRPRSVGPSRDRSHQRKRRRLPTPEPAHDPLTGSALEKSVLSELTCGICRSLLYEPVTTTCQHTFCSSCILRALDDKPACPLCQQRLPRLNHIHGPPVSKIILSILKSVFPNLYDERRAETTEHDNKGLDTPLLVSRLAFPGLPVLLHLDEPRHRRFLRRALSLPSPRIGMIPTPRTGAANEQSEAFGTMLEIKTVQSFPDGRSAVETTGLYRFRVVEKEIIDGYAMGRVQRIDDYPEELENLLEEAATAAPSASTAPIALTNEELVAACGEFIEQLRADTAPWVVQRLHNTVGPMPSRTQLGDFSYWMAMTLPIDEHEKAKLLPIRSPRVRLLMINHWIKGLQDNWWYERGCVIC
ncbi:hypothetical protein BOTBODRAFT_130112 [Botryobasidium botryosum FD-172 SS1]|uniref:RING-type domain-containing protein n=1 Tax=Botryobasidium botryosum (strain FD-172 SS1) TaxID=930990 RepID=A0A067MWV3_BOTB1|nr:hypothetical protein BOTBODRAFT_130112 [Botryobasidium botryosum FD-172 SS1]